MRFKVELHPDVQEFLYRHLTKKEREAFVEVLEKIAEDPLGRSERFYDPKLSRYPVQAFRFGNCLAVFGFSRDRTRIRVRKCKPLPKGN